MMIECCSQERTWLPYYGLIAQRFCMLHRRWQGAFTECFETNYNTIHRWVPCTCMPSLLLQAFVCHAFALQ